MTDIGRTPRSPSSRGLRSHRRYANGRRASGCGSIACAVATGSAGCCTNLVAGGIVAATHHYWSQLHNAKQIGSALLATVLWPLVLLGVNLDIH
jgi:hypothetical protein